MTFHPTRTVRVKALALFSAMAVMATALPAAAQDASTVEPRLRKLETEMRAVQRQVFPGGSDRFFEPEIKAPAQTGTTPGTTGNTAVADLLVRVDALEGQMASLTAQIEENRFRLTKLEQQLASMAAAPAPAPVIDAAPPAAATPVVAAPKPATPTPKPVPVAATPTPSAERVAAVKAIEKPATTDAGEDDYLYGYRLWEAKFYPEAQQQLKLTIERHPRHARISYARNLLGRAYLDDGKPGAAAQEFYTNYTQMPRGDRAPDSLYYLGVSMTRRKETDKACAAFAELAEAYPDVAKGRLATQLARGKADAKCP